MYADLHVHSTFSDGTDTPSELLRKARERGIKALAMADHDTLEGVPELLATACEYGIEAVPAVEISTSVKGLRIHVLGYFVNLGSPSLLSFLKSMTDARTENTRLILDKLNRLGMLDYSWERVLEHRKGKTVIMSTDVFISMMEDGVYSSWEESRDFYIKYFSKQSEAYIDVSEVTAIDAVKAILDADGIPVLAHPKLIYDDSQIEILVDSGLRGIEVFYPAHDRTDIDRYLETARYYGLAVTGGTDCHGRLSARDVQVGDFGVGKEEFLELKSRKK